jgi:hypothetical protein
MADLLVETENYRTTMRECEGERSYLGVAICHFRAITRAT